MIKRVLLTKKCTLAQRELLLNAGISFVTYDAISINHLDFKTPHFVENAIFTSQQGVKSIINSAVKINNCYCVGKKTSALLRNNGFSVVEMAENANALAQVLIKKYKNSVFHYFCGVSRREELPRVLKNEKIIFFEIKTYCTDLNLKQFDQKWDAVLFFSPSGVVSYTTKNSLANTWAICIGETTANQAKKHTNKIAIANTTSVESVIVKTVKILKNN